MTTPGTTEDRLRDDEGTAAGAALTLALEAVAALHEQALATIAELAATWDAPVDGARVLRLAERPGVGARARAAA
jgi:hypothetical protein